MTPRTVISVTINVDLLSEIDNKREDLPRSRFFERALREYLARHGRQEAILA